MMQRAAVIWVIWLSACGPAATAPGPSEPSVAPTASVEPSTAAATSPSSAHARVASATPEASHASAPAREEAPPLRQVCLAMCDKMKSKCPVAAHESCRVNCSKYDPPPAGCDQLVRAALSCARDAADLVCANVAPESCARAFRQLSACAAGQSTAEPEPTEAGLPAGFAHYQNAIERISAPLPADVSAGSGDVLATAKHDGATYSIRKLPRPAGKLNEKVFLKTAMALFGRCTDKMKMQGMVEKPGRTSINYVMTCPDGAEERGVFWATDRALFIASVRDGSEQTGDVFLYGFEAR